ncbi:hypothetical protein LUZ61_003058 [Rhynchospora tenuis]|uniref:EF-hand domain-containing protein n=1 Tax=Rhynchospora tenuis TaxID=198213 RepID=A0AAD5ZK83_9POAL|nr:hypothetical protein LUZ61_003058 [Rhynchospora tenuis]
MRLHTLSIFLFLCVFTALPLCLGRVHGVTSPSKNAYVKGSGDLKTANATNMTALQMHSSFFDRSKDGIITIKETYQGMRALGFSYPISVAGAIFINGALSRKTRPPGTPPTITLPIYIKNIKKGKHGSDTNAYDSKGRFVPKKFEKIFKKYAKTNPNALTKTELDMMLQGYKDMGDIKGQIAAQSEWKLLYFIAKDKDGLLQKDIVRGVYDGSEKTRNKQKKTAMCLQRLSTFLFLCVFTAFALGRANGEASPSQNGTGDSKATDVTPLQMHASFFDRNKDGIVTLKETYEGMRAIGCSVPVSAGGALFINGLLSPKTRPPGKSASASLPIYIENISKGKHGSDTDSYDSQGRFVPEKFEQIFIKYAKTNPNALTSKELDDMLQANKDSGDTKGQIAAQGEWKLLYDLAKDKDGFLQKDTIRGVYDGSLFYKLEQARSSSKNEKS